MALVPEDNARFELRRSRRPWGPALILGFLALAMFMPPVEMLPALAEDWPRLVMLVLAILAAPALLLGVGRRRPLEVIEVLPRAIRLPMGSASVEIPMDEVDGVALEEGDRPGLFVSTSRFVVFFPRDRFSSPEAARAARDVIKDRIGRLPDGARRIQAMEDASVAFTPGPARRPWGTEIMLGVFGVGFIVAVASGTLSLERPLDVLDLGVNAAVLVASGDWWRVPVSTLLHLTLVHLALVGMSLVGLGVAAERLLGTAGFLLVFLGSAVAGSLASAAFPGDVPYTTGASGAVFGLLGALLYVYWSYRGKITLRFQIPERTWFWMLATILLLPILVPTVDPSMHLGGLVAGVLLAILVVGDSEAMPLGRASVSTYLASGAMISLFVASIAFTALARHDRSGDDRRAVMRAMVGAERPDPDFFNRIGWGIAVDPAAQLDDVRAAEKLAERAIQARDHWMYRDTWATLAFRSGDTARAIDLQLEALVDEAASRKKEPRIPPHDVQLATQLARFLDVEVRERGPLALRAAPVLVRARVEEHQLLLSVEGVVAKPTQVWILAREADRLVGLGRYPLPVTNDVPTQIVPRETIAWSKTATLSVAMYSLGEGEAKAWPMDADTLAYPGPIAEVR